MLVLWSDNRSPSSLGNAKVHVWRWPSVNPKEAWNVSLDDTYKRLNSRVVDHTSATRQRLPNGIGA